nr:cell wall protein DAN4 [Bactrocera oleae]
MQQIKNIRKLTGFLLLACIVQACHSATVASTTPLMCYVCEDCAKVTKETPLEACDAKFFEESSTTLEPTTEPTTTTTTEPTMDSTTTTTIGTTLATTTTDSTEVTTTEGTTTEAVPTAPTVGPPVTVPTPPNVGTVAADFLIATEVTISNNSTESTVSYEAPKALPLVSGTYTYHCFSVQKEVNGSVQMERGCSRVTTMESVCGQLKALNNGTELSKCIPCSNNSCNGSSALGVSMAALVFTLIAALLSRQ